MLAEEAADETAAANFAAVFEAAKRHQDFAPGRENGFAAENFAEDDAVAIEQQAASSFENERAVFGFGGRKQGPAAGVVAGSRGAAATVAGAALRVDQRAEIVEAVGGDDAAGDELPKGGFDFGFQAARAANDVGEEGSAGLAEKFEDVESGGTQAAGAVFSGVSVFRRHPIGVVANEEGDGRDAGGDDAMAALF